MDELTGLRWAFDLLLGLGVLGLSWRALTSPDLFTAIVSFVAFGLLMALVWVRLEAPDIALAEAAIGAGLTGALLLAAYSRLPPSAARRAGQPLRLPSWIPAVLMSVVAAALGAAVFTLAPLVAGLGTQVYENLEHSGVTNPVTAVLLNFRGYDTLLEMMVLLVALLDVWSLNIPHPRQIGPPGPVLDSLSRFLAPVFVLVAAYLLWAGADLPGGAFQAGAVLGAGGVLLLLAGWELPNRLAALPLRLTLVAGPGIFLLMGTWAILFGRQLLEYPPAHAGTFILVIEAVAGISIGATLAALFLGERPHPSESR